MDEGAKQENSLASELLHEVKATSKRWFILFIIALLMLFGTNMAWLYAWNLPTEETVTELTSDEGATASATATAIGDIVTLPISALVRLNCDCDTANLTIVISGQAVTAQNLAFVVEKI